ncbi:MAG: universal stress protein, partial [Gemmatimonadota bacterium]
GLLKLCQANLKRAEAMASEHPEVELETQILIGKPFHAILQWAEEVAPTLIIAGRHGSHRIDGTSLGSQADNLCRQAEANLLLVGSCDVRPDEIPWIEEDGRQGLEWAPEAEVRILRVPPFALGIARGAVEEYVLEHYGPGSRYAPAFVEEGWESRGNGRDGKRQRGPSSGASARGAGKRDRAAGEESTPPLTREELPVVTGGRLDEAIRKLLPTHMQLIMGIGDAEELALAEVKAEEAMRRTVVATHDEERFAEPPPVAERCPVTAHRSERARREDDPIVWTHEAFGRLGQVPLIARPLARNTVERFARAAGEWRVTTRVMDENKEAMIQAEEFDLDTMLVMFNELKAKQARAEAAGADGVSEEMRRFIEEAKASGISRCPIRDIEEKADRCPVDFTGSSPEDAERAVRRLMEAESTPGVPVREGGEESGGEPA